MRRTLLVLGALLCGALLFASGGGEKVQSPATQPAGTMARSTIPQHSGEIVVSILASDYSKVAGDALIKAYNALQPNVKVVWEPVATDYVNWLNTQLAAGNVRADIVSGNYVKNYASYVDFNKYRFQSNPYTGKAWSEDFNFTHIDAALTLPDGKRYVLGTQSVDILWIYNKDILDKVGVKPPKNWDEFADVCRKIKAAGYTPIGINYSYQLPQWVSQAYWQQYNQPAKEIAKAVKGDYNYDAKEKYTWNVARFYRGIRDGAIKFNTPEMIEYITNLKKVFPQYATEDLYVITDPYPLFLQQKVAMIVDTTGAFPRIKFDMANLSNKARLQELKIDAATQLAGFAWGAFSHPPMTGGLVNAENKIFESITGEYIAAVDKNQKQTDMVVDFIRFWTSKPGYEAWIAGYQSGERGWQPGGPVIVSGVQLPKEFAELFSSLDLNRGGDPMNTADRLLTTVVGGGAGVQTQAYELFRKALQSEITPKQFAEDFQALVTANLDKIVKAINLPPALLDHPERSPTE